MFGDSAVICNTGNFLVMCYFSEAFVARPIVMWCSGVAIFFDTHDGNKNVSDLIGADQTIAANYSYTPFGALLSSSGSSSPSNPFRFSSEFADDALGLVYYNYRHYNPEIGRWASRDLIEGLYGNRYAFSENETIRAFDFLDLFVPKVIEEFDIKYRENDLIEQGAVLVQTYYDYYRELSPDYSLIVFFSNGKVVENYFAMLHNHDKALDMCRNELFKPLRPPEYNGATL